MAVKAGERMPEGKLLKMGANGVDAVETRDLFAGRRVVVFGLPGAFTGTCSTAHVPSYMRVMPSLTARGVDEVICVAANDPWVMNAWGESTGAAPAGITMLADPSGNWIEALGTSFDAPQVGFHRRSRRFSALVVDGVVEIWHEEAGPGVCEATAGEAMLGAMS